MKRIFLSILMFASIYTINAQSLQSVLKGLEAGNASVISQNISDNVIITLIDKTDTYNKKDAEVQLKDFFTKNKVSSFETKHKGASPNGSFAVGTLKTTKANYRVNVFMKSDAKGEMVKELRIILLE